MHLTALPALRDNIIWALAESGGDAIVVDPGCAEPVERLLDAGMRIAAILVTHHHPDHTGGIVRLRERSGAPCHAPDDPRITIPHSRVVDGCTLHLGVGMRFTVLAVPGHTSSHVAYVGHGLLFCGDTLFTLGCGRLFEGSPAQMLASLDRLARLPAPTRVCCGHDYAVVNARFALTIEPSNAALAAMALAAETGQRCGAPMPSSTIGDERRCNPFLRVDVPAVIASVHRVLGRPPRDRVECFATLREMKDRFTG